MLSQGRRKVETNWFVSVERLADEKLDKSRSVNVKEPGNKHVFKGNQNGNSSNRLSALLSLRESDLLGQHDQSASCP
jgi:hypothetical protein